MGNRGHNSWVLWIGCWALMVSLLPTLAFTAPVGRTRGRANPQSPPPNVQSRVPASSPVVPAPDAGAVAAAPDPSDFSRYNVILDRMPFGSEAAAAAAAAAANATAAAAAAAESFAKNLKLCAITKNHFTGRIQVGLLDSVSKKNYFLYEGDSEDGIALKTADYENEKALLTKDGAEVWMGMSDVKTMQALVGPGGNVAMAPPSLTRNANSSAVPAVSSVPPAPEKPRLTGDALQKHLKEYQMELIRAGGRKGPPLPMPLTPEMDAQLVNEGVLPAHE